MSQNPKSNVAKINPLTPLQEGMLFHSIVDKHSTAYFQQLLLKVEGTLLIEKFRESVNKLIARHEIFRTAFVYEKVKQPMQLVLKERKMEHVTFVDIRSEIDPEAVVQKMIDEDQRNAFDLTKDLLMRIMIVQTGNMKYTILWSYHHMLMDGWSLGIMLNEFFQTYHALATNEPLELENIYPYSDFIKWIGNQDKEEAKEYWRIYMSDYTQAAVINLPKRGSGVKKYEHAELRVSVDNELKEKLLTLSKQWKTTLNIVFQSAWGILLQKYNDCNDVVYGTVVSGRNSGLTGIEKMIGLFINTVLVRIKTATGVTFADLLNQLQNHELLSKRYDYYPFYEIPVDESIRNHIIDHTFIFENFPVENSMKGKSEQVSLKLGSARVIEKTNYDFNVMIVAGDTLEIIMSYNAAVFEANDIERLSGHFIHLLKQATQKPHCPITELELLNSSEKRQIVDDFNFTQREYSSSAAVHNLFTQQTRKTPYRIALQTSEQSISYSELDQKATQLARMLKTQGVEKGQIVGLMTKRSPAMVIGMLGIMKAGGAYLPIDPSYPDERIRYMLEHSQSRLIMTESCLADRVESFDHVLFFEDIAENAINHSLDDGLWDELEDGTSLAYVIYTSGSTGLPKGVMIEHRSIVNFIEGVAERIRFQEGSSILALTTLSFDIFVLETLLPLTKGLTVVIANEAEQLDPKKLHELLNIHPVEFLQATPSRVQLLMNEAADSLSGVRTIMIGGEAVPKVLLERLQASTSAQIFNMYGPTETTVWSVINDLTSRNDTFIGTPIANTQVYVLDHNRRLQPVGVPGELYISGAGLARGYLFHPELTQERFVDNPFASGLMYRTGDLVRWRSEGELEFLGRIDQQVKLRGYRIELGEIEYHLLKHPFIVEAAAVVMDSENGAMLTAYFAAEQPIATSQISEYLAKHVPAYMIPARYMQLTGLPMTPNGKVDRKKLYEMDMSKQHVEESWGPKTEIERSLAEIWKNVLKSDKFGMHDSFFEVGGNSILLVKMHGQIDSLYPDKIDLDDLFAYATIAKIAQKIRGVAQDRRQLNVQSMPLPRDYFLAPNESNEATALSFLMPAETDKLLRELMQDGKFEVHDCLLATYLYLWAEITEESLITVYVIDRFIEGLMPVQIDFDNIEDFDSLFEKIAAMRKNVNVHDIYPVHSMNKEQSADEANVVVLLSYRSDLKREETECFDVALMIDENMEQIHFSCQYNASRLRKDKILSLLNGYVKLIKIVLETMNTTLTNK